MPLRSRFITGLERLSEEETYELLCHIGRMCPGAKDYLGRPLATWARNLAHRYSSLCFLSSGGSYYEELEDGRWLVGQGDVGPSELPVDARSLLPYNEH